MDKVLTDTHRTRAVELFAQGYTRKQVVSFLIDEYPELQEQEQETNRYREKLSDAIKTCDPTATQFALQKYGNLYDTHRKAYIEALKKQYHVVVQQSIQFMLKELQRNQQLIEELDGLIDAAHSIEIEDAGSYTAVLNARHAAQKRVTDIHEKLATRYENVLGFNEENA